MKNRRRSGRALLAAGLMAVAAKLTLVGCDDASAHVYTGEQYDPVLRCLEPLSSIDIVTGPQPGSCAPVCILALPQDAARIAYVSTMCGPYPVYSYASDASGDPLCVAALDAFKRDALCEDGGVVVPAGDGAADGQVDAGADAAPLTPDATAPEAGSPTDAVAPSEATADASGD